jgi:hypothetical protein
VVNEREGAAGSVEIEGRSDIPGKYNSRLCILELPCSTKDDFGMTILNEDYSETA